MRTKPILLAAALYRLAASATFAAAPDDGSVLPFAPSPMAGVAKPRLQDSTMKMT